MKLPGPENVDTVRERLDHVFSRKVLGAVIVAIAAKKMFALGFHLLFASTRVRFVAWTGVFVVAVVLFVWWEHAERTTKRTAEQAARTAATAAEQAADRAAATTESETVQRAEEATDTVAERLGQSADPDGRSAVRSGGDSVTDSDGDPAADSG